MHPRVEAVDCALSFTWRFMGPLAPFVCKSVALSIAMSPRPKVVARAAFKPAPIKFPATLSSLRIAGLGNTGSPLPA